MIRFSNIFRSVTLDLSDEAVSLIRNGRHPKNVLSDKEAYTVVRRLAGKTSDWSMIFIYDSNNSLLWVEPARPARYMSETHRVTV